MVTIVRLDPISWTILDVSLSKNRSINRLMMAVTLTVNMTFVIRL